MFHDQKKIILPQSHPFSSICDLITKAGNCQWFSPLDINSPPFSQFPYGRRIGPKWGLLRNKGSCMSFGMRNFPAIFQRIISEITRKYNLSDFYTAYIDDSLIHSKTFNEQMTHLKALVKALRK